ncbi:hypothetical protein PVAG01_02143 [Phlyctema vagabunda]|uniref:Histone lysine methyltransferase SET associated domain-containing protein n=1 Tax=Phlyctema vagabunda TaxID=108571 RepID=A0ABR4PPS6_9HELO
MKHNYYLMNSRALAEECIERSLPLPGDEVAMISQLIEHDRAARAHAASASTAGNSNSMSNPRNDSADSAQRIAQLRAEADLRRYEESTIFDIKTMMARIKYEEGLVAANTWLNEEIATVRQQDMRRNQNAQAAIMRGVAQASTCVPVTCVYEINPSAPSSLEQPASPLAIRSRTPSERQYNPAIFEQGTAGDYTASSLPATTLHGAVPPTTKQYHWLTSNSNQKASIRDERAFAVNATATSQYSMTPAANTSNTVAATHNTPTPSRSQGPRSADRHIPAANGATELPLNRQRIFFGLPGAHAKNGRTSTVKNTVTPAAATTTAASILGTTSPNEKPISYLPKTTHSAVSIVAPESDPALRFPLSAIPKDDPKPKPKPTVPSPASPNIEIDLISPSPPPPDSDPKVKSEPDMKPSAFSAHKYNPASAAHITAKRPAMQEVVSNRAPAPKRRRRAGEDLQPGDELDLSYEVETEPVQPQLNPPYIRLQIPGHEIGLPYMEMIDFKMREYAPQGVRADKKAYYVIFEKTPEGWESAARCQRAYNGKIWHDSKLVLELFK